MPFIGNFDIVQNGVDTVTLTDTSTGSDPTITTRTISLGQYNNTNLNSTTYDWPIADSTITLSGVLLQDYGLNVNVVWETPTPDPAGTYNVTKLIEFDFYDMIFLGQLIAERFARYPAIVNDNNFMNNFMEYYFFIVSARIATGLMNDIFKTQFALDMATFRRIKQNNFF